MYMYMHVYQLNKNTNNTFLNCMEMTRVNKQITAANIFV